MYDTIWDSICPLEVKVYLTKRPRHTLSQITSHSKWFSILSWNLGKFLLINNWIVCCVRTRHIKLCEEFSTYVENTKIPLYVEIISKYFSDSVRLNRSYIWHLTCDNSTIDRKVNIISPFFESVGETNGLDQ